ncbi:MAG: tetratricopeptide repeat protein [Bacteroidetes bacterium]|nr:tetratricopeptide repeat protein [Bacteroidota bacterium]
MRTFLAALLFFQFTAFLQAQQDKTDSLEAAAEKMPDGTARVDAWNQLSRELLYTDEYKCADYFSQAGQLSKKINYKKGLARATTLRANLYLVKNKSDSALSFYLDALKIYGAINDKDGEASVYQDIGLLDYYQGDLKNSSDNFNLALGIYSSTADSAGMCEVMNNMGVVQFATHDNANALKNYFAALALSERIGNTDAQLNSLNNIGSYYKAEGDFEKAISYYQQTVNISQKKSDNRGIALALVNLSSVYGDQKNYDKSIEFALNAESYAEKANATDLKKNIYQSLAMSYAFKGDYEKAFGAQQDYTNASEKLLNEKNLQLTRDLEAKYKSEQNKKQISELNKENKIGTLTIYIISAGLILLFIIALFVYTRYRANRKTASILAAQKSLIEVKNTELERLSIVARSTENIVLIMNAQGEIEWANESFARWNGITIEELKAKKGKTIFEISNNPRVRAIVDEAVREKKSIVYESLNKNPEGGSIWESSTLTPVFGENGMLQRLIIVDTDITQRKKDEEIIQQKNKDITDSITYARRIQEAILPPEKIISRLLPESFVLYKPKDIVSGDFYWIEQWGDAVLVAAVDCTGHGVPGAFMSLLGYNLMNQALNEFGLNKPSLMLNAVSKNLSKILRTAGDGTSVKDGMDIALCSIDRKKMILEFSGAYNPAWIIRDGKRIELAGDKFPVGAFVNDGNLFSNKEFPLEKNDCIYIFTDGYADQFGGPRGKKFKYKQLEELLLKIHREKMSEQKRILEKEILEWKGGLDQIDDILVIGIRC